MYEPLSLTLCVRLRVCVCVILKDPGDQGSETRAAGATQGCEDSHTHGTPTGVCVCVCVCVCMVRCTQACGLQYQANLSQVATCLYRPGPSLLVCYRGLYNLLSVLCACSPPTWPEPQPAPLNHPPRFSFRTSQISTINYTA